MSDEKPAMTKRDHQKSPCSSCPFRRESMPGWLGDASPERFVLQLLTETPLPCHPTVDYDDPEWSEKWETRRAGKLCAGALVMLANICKMPRDPTTPVMKPSDEVFSTLDAFREHHRSAKVRSWSAEEERCAHVAWETYQRTRFAAGALTAFPEYGKGGD